MKKQSKKTETEPTSKKAVAQTKTHIHKKAFLKALEKAMGVVSTASKITDIARQTHYEWYKEDKDYAIAVDSLKDLAIDFAESKLLRNIDRGSDTAIIFFLKTQGKKRGYIERTEIEHDGKLIVVGRTDTLNAKK